MWVAGGIRRANPAFLTTAASRKEPPNVPISCCFASVVQFLAILPLARLPSNPVEDLRYPVMAVVLYHISHHHKLFPPSCSMVCLPELLPHRGERHSPIFSKRWEGRAGERWRRIGKHWVKMDDIYRRRTLAEVNFMEGYVCLCGTCW